MMPKSRRKNPFRCDCALVQWMHSRGERAAECSVWCLQLVYDLLDQDYNPNYDLDIPDPHRVYIGITNGASMVTLMYANTKLGLPVSMYRGHLLIRATCSEQLWLSIDDLDGLHDLSMRIVPTSSMTLRGVTNLLDLWRMPIDYSGMLVSGRSLPSIARYALKHGAESIELAFAIACRNLEIDNARKLRRLGANGFEPALFQLLRVVPPIASFQLKFERRLKKWIALRGSSKAPPWAAEDLAFAVRLKQAAALVG